MQKSLEIFLRARPEGMLDPARDFGTRTITLASHPPPRHVLVRLLFLSADPAMRGWMSAARSYIEPVALGERMRAAGVGEVVAAGDGARLDIGDLVTGLMGWGEYALVPRREVTRVVAPPGVSVSACLGVLGGTGLTALYGLERIGRPKKGGVVVVTASAGATGSVVAQMAKNVYGCYVVGIAGGERKCAYLRDEVGVDAAVDYKAGGIREGLKEALGGRRVDVFFDSVGGEMLEAGLGVIAVGGAVVVCGAIGEYNKTAEEIGPGPRNYMQLLVQRARMEGFVVLDYVDEWASGRRRLAEMVVDGKLQGKEVVYDGMEKAGDALLDLFKGENIGKVVIKVADSQFGHGEGEVGIARGKL